jgi:hypothetical protein
MVERGAHAGQSECRENAEGGHVPQRRPAEPIQERDGRNQHREKLRYRVRRQERVVRSLGLALGGRIRRLGPLGRPD